METEKLNALENLKNTMLRMGYSQDYDGFEQLAERISRGLSKDDHQIPELLITYFNEGRFPSVVIDEIIKIHNRDIIPPIKKYALDALIDNDIKAEIEDGTVKLVETDSLVKRRRTNEADSIIEGDAVITVAPLESGKKVRKP